MRPEYKKFRDLVKYIFPLLLTIILTVLLNTRFGSVPPLGKFLDPMGGFWRNAETNPPPAVLNLKIDGLQAPVEIRYDSLGIPHIFASNEHDLYLVQGYVTARDRLWQMEFLTYSAAGRISEFVGARAEAYDKHQRRIGMTEGARIIHELNRSDETIQAAISAYTSGVNAYIQSLRPHQYPLEYKLLDYKPEPWTDFKAALLAMNLSQDLSYNTHAVTMSNTRTLFSDDEMQVLYPDYMSGVDPIIPPGTPWNFVPLPVPQPPPPFEPGSLQDTTSSTVDPNTGSNNWAVSGQKTASGRPILASDPHLTLRLPSIWYMNQLAAPGYLAKGVSFPGGPTVIKGFNTDIAWGLTNTGSSVVDVYELKLRNNNAEYFHNGVWKPTQMVVETYRVRGKGTVTDTIYHTHHGPIVYHSGQTPLYSTFKTGHAYRWSALHQSRVLFRTFYEINKAANVNAFRAALEHFQSPSQNFAYADRHGDIALLIAGQMPLKWTGQGKLISDGSNPVYDWAEWIPYSHNPKIINPPRQFVSSANQHPADETYPYYLDWSFASGARGFIINQELARMQDITADSMRALQMNTRNLWAERTLPVLLPLLESGDWSDSETLILNELAGWNRLNDRNETGATIYAEFWNRLYVSIWEPYFPKDGLYRRPSLYVTARLITGEADGNRWLNRMQDAGFEDLGTLARRSFREAVQQLERTYGTYGDSWQYGFRLNARVNHMLNIPALGSGPLFASGSGESVNALSGTHGPSWRLVAELKDSIEAQGIYPGGQSGNPGSRSYTRFLNDWVEGRLYPLPLYPDPASMENATVWKIVMEPKSP